MQIARERLGYESLIMPASKNIQERTKIVLNAPYRLQNIKVDIIELSPSIEEKVEDFDEYKKLLKKCLNPKGKIIIRRK